MALLTDNAPLTCANVASALQGVLPLPEHCGSYVSSSRTARFSRLERSSRILLQPSRRISQFAPLVVWSRPTVS